MTKNSPMWMEIKKEVGASLEEEYNKGEKNEIVWHLVEISTNAFQISP